MPFNPSLSISANFSLFGQRLVALEGGVAPTPTPTPTPGIANVVPAAAWNGTGGSGFTTVPTQTGSVLAVRPEYGYMLDTIAPVRHWVSPLYTDDLFTDDKIVAVSAWAAANEGIDGGIAKVTFNVEGTTQDVTRLSLVDVPVNTAGGTVQGKWPCYAIKLPWADIPALGQGAIDIYATIYPNDTSIATATIGPMRLYRKTGYDRIVDIAPSQATAAPTRYQTAQAALAAVRTTWASGEHITLRYLENGVIDATALDFTGAITQTNGKRGHVRVTGNGFDVLAKRTTGGLFRPQFNGLIFERIRIDTANISQFLSEPAQSAFRATVLRNCEIFSSNGKVEFVGDPTASPPVTKTTRAGGAKQCFNSPIVMEHCYLHDMLCGDISVPVMVGCRVRDVTNDSLLMTGSQPFMKLLCDEERVTGEPVRVSIPSLQLAYSGTGAATWETSGNEFASRTLVLRVAGTSVGSFTIPVDPSADNYTFEQLAASIIGALGGSGWNATVVDTGGVSGTARWRANHLGSALTAIPAVSTQNPANGPAIGARPISEVIVASTDGHTDNAQLGGGAFSHENVLVANNAYRECVSQAALIAVQQMTRRAFNVAYIQNAAENIATYDKRDELFVQVQGPISHLLLVQNSFPDQGISIRLDVGPPGEPTQPPTVLDAYSRVYANVAASLTIPSGPSVVSGSALNGKVKNNIIVGMIDATATANVAGNLSVGSAVASFPNINVTPFTNADFSPAPGSGVVTNRVKAELSFDRNGNNRGALAMAGAVA